ncbi:MAG: DUF72 domain-containing protein [Planctomycetota bacterium]
MNRKPPAENPVPKTGASPGLPMRLGCPVFQCEHWASRVYPAGAPKTRWLHWYSRMFNTVEGNSTFYGLPSRETIKRWANEAAPGFRFALKMPRGISHESRLVGCEGLLREFVALARLLHDSDRLGPSFLQLGPDFSPRYRSQLLRFLDQLPPELPWAVEVRHLDWFDQAENEASINQDLSDRNIDKVLFDSRPLYQAPPDDPIEAVSQTRKPKTPVRQTVTAEHPFLRLVGRNRLELTQRFIEQWVPIVLQWVRDGHQPYIFTHAPNDQFAPMFARRFWETYCEAAGEDPAMLPPEYLPAVQRTLFET